MTHNAFTPDDPSKERAVAGYRSPLAVVVAVLP
jgi:hypothetical protein